MGDEFNDILNDAAEPVPVEPEPIEPELLPDEPEEKPPAPTATLYCVFCLDQKGKKCKWEENKYVSNAAEEKCPECGSDTGCTTPKPELMK